MKSRVLKYKISKKISHRFEYPKVSKTQLEIETGIKIPRKVVKAPITSEGSEKVSAGINRTVVVGFCALQNFKEILPRYENKREQLTNYLNEFIESITGIIEDQGGIAERFEKNGILFFFGAEGIKQDDFSNAVLTALKIRYRMNKLNRTWNLYYDDSWKTGIGITVGTTYVLRSGSPRNYSYSLKGDLSLLVRGLGSSAGSSQIIVTEEMYKNQFFPKNLFEVKNPFHIQAQGMDHLTRVREVIALIKGNEII